MRKTLTVKIVSDVSCPWCAVGYHELKQAMNEFASEADSLLDVEISWLPFEINPDMSKEGQDVASYLQQKYAMTPDTQRQTMATIEGRGKSVGFEFKPMKDRHIYNSFDCHCLLAVAANSGLQTPLKVALFELYFKQGGDISDRQVLTECALRVGLSQEDINTAFDDEQLRQTVVSQMTDIKQAGITSVPTLIINDKYTISGAQGVAGYKDILRQVNETL